MSAEGENPATAGSTWHWFELVVALTSRSLNAQYSQSLLGIAWVVIQPLVLMVVMSIVFTLVFRVPTDGAPYPAFVLCGLAGWYGLIYPLNQATASLVDGSNLLRKVAFPRAVLPIAAMLMGLLDTLLVFATLLLLLLFYGIPLGVHVLWFPPVFAVQILLVLGLSLICSAANVFYRDVGMALPILLQLGLYLTPVFYPSDFVPAEWRHVFLANPMAVLIDAYRDIFLYQKTPSLQSLGYVAAVAALVAGSALVFFRRVENRFADVI